MPRALDEALAWAREGYAIFPCHPEHRAPVSENGVKDATTDEDRIRRWWSGKHSGAIIGLAGGDIVFVDCDVDKETGECVGETTLEKVCPEAFDEAAVQVRTPSGGRHLYFGRDPDMKNWVKRLPGIDVRTTGGYVIAPPSPGYEFVRGSRDEMMLIGRMPARLRDALIEGDKEKRQTAMAVLADRQGAARPTRAATPEEIEAYRPMAERAFVREVEAVRTCESGRRNHQLNTSAFNLGQLAGAGVFDEREVETRLRDAAVECGLEPEEIEKTLKSGLTSGKKRPRDIALALSKREGGEVDEFLRRYVFVEQGNRVADLDRPAGEAICTLDEFRNSTANVRIEVPAPTQREPDKTKMEPVHRLWITDPERKSARRTIYHPKEDRLVDEKGLLYVNTYEPPEWPEECDRDPPREWCELLELLFPVEAERDLICRWAAWTVWKPQRRSPIAPIVVTPQEGTGKGMFGRLMSALVGKNNTSRPKMKALTGDFQDFLHECVLTIVDEAAEDMEGRKRFTIMDNLRDLLTEPEIRINLKFEPARTVPVFTNFLFLSNHRDAIALSPQDRRLFVVLTDAHPREMAFYDRLAEIIEDRDELGAIAAWLRPWADRNLPQRAPHTKGREEMIASAMPAWADTLKDRLSEKPGATWTMEAILSLIPTERPQPRHLGNVLRRSLGMTSCRVRIDGKRRALWFPAGSDPDLENFQDTSEMV